VTSRAPKWGGRGRGQRLTLASSLLALVAPSIARAAAVQIAIVADGPCPQALHDRIAEQLAEVAGRVSWSCLPSFDAEDPFRSSAARPDALQIWVDVTPRTEARLTLRDPLADRFVVRRIPLPRGLDEIAREEIGQIVRSAALAVLAGPAATLTREQARAEISRWAQPAPPTSPPPPVTAPPGPSPGPAPGREASRSVAPVQVLKIAPLLSARVFASPIPLVAEVGVSAAVGKQQGLGIWMDAAYQLPARDRASPVGVELDALAIRAGLLVSLAVSRALVARLGAGAGFTRTSFTPLGDSSAVTTDPAAAFVSLTGRLFAGVDLRAGREMVLGVALFCDAVGADVHYDLRASDGSTQRVLTPLRLQPGAALQIGWSP
jgi:hypothetical protein